MPIDARIPLSVDPTPMPDYLSQYRGALQLREMVRMSDDRQRERDRLQEEEDKRKRMLGSFVFDPEGRLDPETTLRNIGEFDPMARIKLQQQWDLAGHTERLRKFEADKAEQEAEMAELNTAAEKMAMGAKLLGSANDPRTFQEAMQKGLQYGVLTEEDVAAHPEFDTDTIAWIKQLEDMVRTASQRIQERQEDIASQREATEWEQTQLTNAMAVGSQLSKTVTGPRSLTAVHEATGGLLRPFIGDADDPDSTQLMLSDIGRTPQERATGAAAADTRAETKRHNLQLEKAARDRTKEGGANRQKEIDSLRGEAKEIAKKLDEVHARRTLLGKGLETGTYYPKGSGKPEKMPATDEEDSEGRQKAVKAEIEALKTEAAMLTKRRDTKIREIRRFEGDPAPPGLSGSPGGPAPVATRSSKQPRRVDPATGQTSPTQTYSEKEIRQRAKARGLEPDSAVDKARRAGIIR